MTLWLSAQHSAVMLESTAALPATPSVLKLPHGASLCTVSLRSLVQWTAAVATAKQLPVYWEHFTTNSALNYATFIYLISFSADSSVLMTFIFQHVKCLAKQWETVVEYHITAEQMYLAFMICNS